MTATRIECVECSNLILPEAAAANAGLCGPCATTPEPLRRATREFQHQLASGAWFTPNPAERASATRPAEFGHAGTTWAPEHEFYKGRDALTVGDLLMEAAAQTAGDVFLVSHRGSRLNLSFNEAYGVCDYQSATSGDSRYAYTAENRREHVAERLHLVQACPCCGVGMLWYPSRFHMPRRVAVEVVSGVVFNQAPGNVEWLAYGDISYTSRGRGWAQQPH